MNRIDIPEEEDAMLFINLEMLKNENVMVADFKTTNNLNGTYPFDSPSSATIRVLEIISGGTFTEQIITFTYDDDIKKYVSPNNQGSLKIGRTYKLEAQIEDSEFDQITAFTKVPYLSKISEFELKEEGEYEDEAGNKFWQGTIGMTFSEAVTHEARYGHLQIEEFLTYLVQIGPDQYENQIQNANPEFFELVKVNEGIGAVTDIIHRAGFFIEFDELEEDYLEIVIRSKFSITAPNQVTDVLHTNLITVSKEHFDYHIAFHNILQSQGNIFEEDALYNSNIDNGQGLFSSCVRMKETLELRK